MNKEKDDDIDKEFDHFMEFPSEAKDYVTSTSAKLFARYCVEKVQKEMADSNQLLCNSHTVTVKSINVSEVKKTLKSCPKPVRDYIKSLEKSLANQKRVTAIAIRKLKDGLWKMTSL